MPPQQHLHSLNVWITSQVVDANNHRMVSIRIVQLSTTGDHRPMAKTRAGGSGVAAQGQAEMAQHLGTYWTSDPCDVHFGARIVYVLAAARQSLVSGLSQN